MSKEHGTSLFKKSHSQWCTVRHKKQTICRSHESSIVPAERTHPLCWLHSALSFISALVPENFLVPLLLRSVHALKTNKQTKQINQTRGPFWEEKISKQTASSPICRWKTSLPSPCSFTTLFPPPPDHTLSFPFVLLKLTFHLKLSNSLQTSVRPDFHTYPLHLPQNQAPPHRSIFSMAPVTPGP